MKTKEDTKTYTGIADCHGIESFNLMEGTNQSFLLMRAGANPQRHAVVYEADLSDFDKEVILGLLKDGEFETALKYMSNESDELRVAGGETAAEMWRKIPNPELDPYA